MKRPTDKAVGTIRTRWLTLLKTLDALPVGLGSKLSSEIRAQLDAAWPESKG